MTGIFMEDIPLETMARFTGYIKEADADLPHMDISVKFCNAVDIIEQHGHEGNSCPPKQGFAILKRFEYIYYGFHDVRSYVYI